MLSQSVIFGALSIRSSLNRSQVPTQGRWFDFNQRHFTTAATDEAKTESAAQHSKTVEQLHTNALRKEMGPIASARRPNRYRGNYKFLASIAVIFAGIYYYSIWKVGQDDFSDVDEFGNVREKV